ncbi:putative replication initiation protein [Eel River basin pequenovirus]|nr:putative replication initiation protein [Eel River basin pequenovirus]
MPCYYPRDGWRSRSVNPETGRRSVVFDRKAGFEDMPVTVPCGQCIGCRLERSRQWAMRCMHEAQLHDDNCFLTLTYDDEHLPEDGSLDVKHFQDFMKRLRERIKPRKVRFFHCGEYGEQTLRPHYHALLFGFDFPDRVFYTTRNGNSLDISPTLQELWGHGFCTVGALTFESAAYVARYVLKKVTGDGAEDHYTRVNSETGEIVKVRPEYTTMSRRPGIAADWWRKYRQEVIDHDSVILRGREMRPPAFYDRLLEVEEPELHARMKAKRKAQGERFAHDNTTNRLRTREKVKRAQVTFLKRTVE